MIFLSDPPKISTRISHNRRPYLIQMALSFIAQHIDWYFDATATLKIIHMSLSLSLSALVCIHVGLKEFCRNRHSAVDGNIGWIFSFDVAVMIGQIGKTQQSALDELSRTREKKNKRRTTNHEVEKKISKAMHTHQQMKLGEFLRSFTGRTEPLWSLNTTDGLDEAPLARKQGKII